MARILIDQSHNQAWAVDPSIAARMNPSNPADASYQELVATLEQSGYEVAAHNAGLISEADLTNVDVLLIPHASTEDWERTIGSGSPVLAESELVAIEQFVANGGGLLLLGETCLLYTSPSPRDS